MKRGFTLIELIVVIIIVGILAALGISQYTKTVEKARGAEAKMILGQMRTLAYQYRLENGTINGLIAADVNVGLQPDQAPESSHCRSTHYFQYGVNQANEPFLQLCAWRCSSGGKSPQGLDTNYICRDIYYDTGVETWETNGAY